MARTFYTERDIEDMAKRGVTEIELNDSVYITDTTSVYCLRTKVRGFVPYSVHRRRHH